MKIYLKEDKLIIIKESEENVTFYKFFTEVKNFIKDLLDDPIHAKPSGFFSSHGISKSVLLNKMMDKDIISKKENIDEPQDADGKMKSMHYLQYKVPKKNFEQKIKRLYSYFFENEKRKEGINESLFDDVKPQKYDSVAVYIFCKDKNGDLYVLAGKRRGFNNGGLYNVPTGQVGDKIYGETVTDAAAREVSEESGININQSLLKDVGDEEYTNRYGVGLGKNFMTVLNGTIDNYRPGMGDGENEPFQWIPVTDIKMYQWAFGQDKHIYNIINSL
jgi:8-oxo-dGTP pyrophosphatase MutT (NUDIX family)